MISTFHTRKVTPIFQILIRLIFNLILSTVLGNIMFVFCLISFKSGPLSCRFAWSGAQRSFAALTLLQIQFTTSSNLRFIIKLASVTIFDLIMIHSLPVTKQFSLSWTISEKYCTLRQPSLTALKYSSQELN